MLRMRRGDIDHIQAIVGHDLLIRPVRLRQAGNCCVARAWPTRSVERLATATASASATCGKSLITGDAIRPGR